MVIKKLLLSEVAKGKNPRKTFHEKAIKELADSIEKHGLLQPIVVKKDPNTKRFAIVDGERRYRAMVSLGLEEAICVVRSDEQTDALSIIANLQRQDVAPLEEAEAFWELRKAGSSEADIAELVGKSLSFIRNRICLHTQLSKDFKHLLSLQALSITYALKLARLSHEGQEKAYRLLVRKYTVSEEDGSRVERYAVGSQEQLSSAIRAASSNQLHKAPFDLKEHDLYASAGGACSACEKRTKHNAGLFEDVIGYQDLCLDSLCFQDKVEIHYQREKDKLGEPTAKVASTAFNMPEPAMAKPYSSYTHLNFVEPNTCLKPDPIMYIGEFEPYIKYACGCGSCATEEEAKPQDEQQPEAEEQVSEAEKARRLQELNDLPFQDEDEEKEAPGNPVPADNACKNDKAVVEDPTHPGDPFKAFQIFSKNTLVEGKALAVLLAFAIYDNQFLEEVREIDWYESKDGKQGVLTRDKRILQMQDCLCTANNYIAGHLEEEAQELLNSIYTGKLKKYQDTYNTVIQD